VPIHRPELGAGGPAQQTGPYFACGALLMLGSTQMTWNIPRRASVAGKCPGVDCTPGHVYLTQAIVVKILWPARLGDLPGPSVRAPPKLEFCRAPGAGPGGALRFSPRDLCPDPPTGTAAGYGILSCPSRAHPYRGWY
jgi:hypothetical protein